MPAENNNAVTAMPSRRPCAKSVQAKSTSQLANAIRSPETGEIDELVMREARAVINLGFVPDWTGQELADVLHKFVIALRDLPAWAIRRAFAEWTRTRTRRPYPAEIRQLAQEAMRPIAEELATRRKALSAPAAQPRPKVSPERAAEILAELGFDDRRNDMVKRFPRARNLEEAG